jgi:hypothetical protein
MDECEDPDMADAVSGPIYALNWFDIADREEYLVYARRSSAEWKSRAHFDAYWEAEG